jgi:hypothetical protein
MDQAFGEMLLKLELSNNQSVLHINYLQHLL